MWIMSGGKWNDDVAGTQNILKQIKMISLPHEYDFNHADHDDDGPHTGIIYDLLWSFLMCVNSTFVFFLHNLGAFGN